MTNGNYDGPALAVAILALLLSGGGLWFQGAELSNQKEEIEAQHSELETQAQELDAQRRGLQVARRTLREMAEQFDASGPNLQAAVSLQARAKDGGDFEQPFPVGGEIITDWDDSYDVWVIATMTNVGRTPGPLKSVGILNAPTEYHAIVPQCSSETDVLVNCALPLSVGVGDSVRLYLNLTDHMPNLRCNPFVRDNGIMLFYAYGAQEWRQFASGIDLAQRARCPSPAVP